MTDLRLLLDDVAARAADHRAGVAEARVFPAGEPAAAVRAGLGVLRDQGADPADVLAELAAAVEPGLVATTGPRYFGFVIGGALPAATARRHARGRLGPARVQRGPVAGRGRGRGGRPAAG